MIAALVLTTPRLAAAQASEPLPADAAGEVVFEDRDGIPASMIEFDGALFMGPLDPCFDDPAFDTKVFHAFETDDPDIGTAAGYLCCADENECAERVP